MTKTQCAKRGSGGDPGWWGERKKPDPGGALLAAFAENQ